MKDLLFGAHAVREALRARKRHFGCLWTRQTAKGRTSHAGLCDLARTQGVTVRQTPQGVFRDLDKAGSHHQGVALEAGPLPLASLDQMWALCEQQAELPLLLILDHVQDPHNMGAIIRSAEVCGVHGVITPRRRACPLSPAVSQASAGALEHMLVAQVTNLSRTMGELQARGVWIAGLEADGKQVQDIAALDLDRALALVVGHEGSGLSRRVREQCDFLMRLAMQGQIASFNASNAAAIALYLARQDRRPVAARNDTLARAHNA